MDEPTTKRPRPNPAPTTSADASQLDDADSVVEVEMPVNASQAHPWKRVMNIQSLRLSANVQDRIESCGTDPMKFLNEHTWLNHSIDEFDAGTIGDAFMACYTYTKELEDKEELGRVRWLFQMLMFWDLVKLIRPGGSGRIGHIMEAELRAFLGPLQQSLDSESAVVKMSEWKCCGEKLDVLCQRFGPGCLFLLGTHLSRHL